MSPLVSPPNRGYADWQRVENYDSGVLWSVTPVIGNVTITSPVIDMSRFAYTGGTITELLTQSNVQIAWYEDAAGTVIVGGRLITLSAFLVAAAQLRLPNLGPFMKMQVPGGGANFDFGAQIFGTNRVHPLEFIPFYPYLIDQQAVAIAATTTATVYPVTYYAGPVAVFLSAPFATGTVQLQYLDQNGNWDTINQISFAAAGNFSPIWVTPGGAWRFQVQNGTAGASTYTLAVIPSTSGAS